VYVVCVGSSGRTLGDGVVGKAPIMTICTWQYSGGVNLVCTCVRQFFYDSIIIIIIIIINIFNVA